MSIKKLINMQKNKRRVIGIVSLYNPKTDLKAHSGILYKINKAVKDAGYETRWIRIQIPISYKFLSLCCRVIHKLTGHTIYLDRTFIGSKLICNTIDNEALMQSDVVMIIHYQHILYGIKTDKPVIYHSDATFELINNYYLHNMYQWNERQAEYMEKTGLNKATLHLSSSAWRQDSIINHYGISAEKCRELEYGPCVETDGIRSHSFGDGILRILFMGVDWERKGGDIAVETVRLLNERGIKTQLIIVGLHRIPESCRGENYIDFRGYLNKNIPEQYDELKQIFSLSELLLLPTKAECSAVVFCESQHYGLPVITYDTGGVGSYVVNGVSGYRLPEGAPAEAFADKIEQIIKDGEQPKLSTGALQYAQNKLTWSNWTECLKEYFDNNEA